MKKLFILLVGSALLAQNLNAELNLEKLKQELTALNPQNFEELRDWYAQNVTFKVDYDNPSDLAAENELVKIYQTKRMELRPEEKEAVERISKQIKNVQTIDDLQKIHNDDKEFQEIEQSVFLTRDFKTKALELYDKTNNQKDREKLRDLIEQYNL